MYYLLQYEGLTRNGRVFDMRGMLPHSEARMRMCVMKVADRGRWTYRGLASMALLWKFFPWYAREMRYRGHFLSRTGLHALVLGERRKEGAGLLFGSGLADAEHDVGGGIGGPWALEQPNQRGSSTAGCSASGGWNRF